MSNANLNDNIVSLVSTDAPPVSTAGFGIPLWASFDEVFAERVRRYTSAADAAADAELSASAVAAVSAAFSQNPAPSQVAVGRMDDLEAQVTDVLLGGSVLTGDKFKITIGEVEYEVTVASVETPAAAAALLRAAMASDPLVNVTGADEHVVATSKIDGQAFDLEVSKTSTSGTITATETTANVGVADGLDAILDEDAGWYGFSTEELSLLNMLDIGAWADANKRFFVGQSSEAGILTTGTTDVAYRLKALSRLHAAVVYHDSDETEYLAFGWLALTLTANPDEETTIWAYKSVVGAQVDVMTTTQKNNALAKNCNVYLPFMGVPSTWRGRMANGQPCDVVITMDWLDARITEALAQLQLNYSARNTKIPHTEKGRALIENTVFDILSKGVTAGHLTPGSASVTINEPTKANKTARHLEVSWQAELAGAVETIRISGSVPVDI